ncbi:hypothetical protein ACTA71_002340 [Dictyostelium dimigraforme]
MRIPYHWFKNKIFNLYFQKSFYRQTLKKSFTFFPQFEYLRKHIGGNNNNFVSLNSSGNTPIKERKEYNKTTVTAIGTIESTTKRVAIVSATETVIVSSTETTITTTIKTAAISTTETTIVSTTEIIATTLNCNLYNETIINISTKNGSDSN